MHISLERASGVAGDTSRACTARQESDSSVEDGERVGAGGRETNATISWGEVTQLSSRGDIVPKCCTACHWTSDAAAARILASVHAIFSFLPHPLPPSFCHHAERKFRPVSPTLYRWFGERRTFERVFRKTRLCIREREKLETPWLEPDPFDASRKEYPRFLA